MVKSHCDCRFVLGHNRENLLVCLSDLFHNIATQKKKVGTIAPKKFICRLKKENDVFDNYMQQDAHEFLNYLLNTIADILQGRLSTVIVSDSFLFSVNLCSKLCCFSELLL